MDLLQGHYVSSVSRDAAVPSRPGVMQVGISWFSGQYFFVYDIASLQWLVLTFAPNVILLARFLLCSPSVLLLHWFFALLCSCLCLYDKVKFLASESDTFYGIDNDYENPTNQSGPIWRSSIQSLSSLVYSARSCALLTCNLIMSPLWNHDLQPGMIFATWW